MNFENQSVKHPLGKELLNLTTWTRHHNQLISNSCKYLPSLEYTQNPSNNLESNFLFETHHVVWLRTRKFLLVTCF